MARNINTPPNTPNQAPHQPHISALDVLNVIANVRLRRAERTVERMEHKDELYENLGAAAVAGSRRAPAAGEPRPRTVPEQIKDFGMQRRSDKKAKADIYAWRARQIHGPDSARPIPSVRHGITEAALGVVTDRPPSHGLFDVLKENTMRVFRGASIPGYSRIKRLIEKGKVGVNVAGGTVTAAEARQRWTEINAEELKLGNKMHKETRRELRHREERAGLAAEQPVLTRWREGRRHRAQRRIAEARVQLENLPPPPHHP